MKSSGGERQSLTPQDWEQAALELIADQGVGALGVEPLARRLEITKGSFYWHFDSRDELLVRALRRWENQDTQHLRTALATSRPAAERLTEFAWRSSRQTLTHRIYAALCAMPSHPRIGPVLRRVSERRIRYLAVAFGELGMARATARRHADLLYSSYVGYLQLQAQGLVPDKERPEFDDYVRHVIATLIEGVVR